MFWPVFLLLDLLLSHSHCLLCHLFDLFFIFDFDLRRFLLLETELLLPLWLPLGTFCLKFLFFELYGSLFLLQLHNVTF